MSRATDLAIVAWRDGPLCYLCGQGAVHGDPWEEEHRVPRVAGGPDDVVNKGLAHRSCNRKKGARPIR